MVGPACSSSIELTRRRHRDQEPRHGEEEAEHEEPAQDERCCGDATEADAGDESAFGAGEETQTPPSAPASYLGRMDVNLSELSPAEAVAATLRGWGDEPDRGEKFWLMDWNNMIRDVIRALRTGEPVLYEDDD